MRKNKHLSRLLIRRLYEGKGFPPLAEGEDCNKIGNGAMEKNMELVVARRFKKWRMSWSKPGALG